MEEIGGSNNDSRPRVCTGKPPRQGGTIVPASQRKPRTALHASVSAQDLLYFDFEKEAGDVVECFPRGVLEDGLRSSDSDILSKASTSFSETRSNSSSPWQGFFRLWKHKSMRRLSSFPPVGFRKRSSKRRNREIHVVMPDSTSTADECCFLKPTWKNFTIAELQKATNNFSPENIIGKGGFAEIYKGCLENGQLIAVKRITKGTTDERTHNFLCEMGILVHVGHPNIASLIGVGVEGGLHLVLELSHHGSLENLLHDKDSKHKLDWEVRYKVAIGTAKGLEYLHEWCQRRIIHRDIKVANILLTADFEPQICDFGLAKWLPDELTHHTLSSFEGTFGYLAPEYCMHGVVDEKTDVFAFGILLLEIITGRKAVDPSKQSLLTWAKPLLEQNNVKDLIDPFLGDSFDSKELNHAANTANMCTQQSSVQRPRMSQVVRLLRGEEGRSVNMRMLQKPSIRRTYSEEIFDAEEYNSTRYLNDRNRHMEIAFDF